MLKRIYPDPEYRFSFRGTGYTMFPVIPQM